MFRQICAEEFPCMCASVEMDLKTFQTVQIIASSAVRRFHGSSKQATVSFPLPKLFPCFSSKLVFFGVGDPHPSGAEQRGPCRPPTSILDPRWLLSPKQNTPVCIVTFYVIHLPKKQIEWMLAYVHPLQPFPLRNHFKCLDKFLSRSITMGSKLTNVSAA